MRKLCIQPSSAFRPAVVLLAGALVFLGGDRSFAAPSLRTEVPRVDVTTEPMWKATLETMAHDWAVEGYDDESVELRGLAFGCWGTATYLQLDDGTRWLVTNRHVVATSGRATLRLNSPDGAPRDWPDVRVMYRDPKVDIAILEAPVDWPGHPLKLQTTPTDGLDVWSAGYPGLGGHPEWQLSKGTITNAHVVVEGEPTLGDSFFIQHSASIDPGSSGGPLVTGAANDLAAGQVLGINTWSAIGRHNAFYALPAEQIIAAIQRYRSGTPPSLESSVQRFLEATEASEVQTKATAPLLDRAWVATAALPAWKRVSMELSSSERRQWVQALSNDPATSLAEFYCYYLWSQVGGRHLTWTRTTQVGNPEPGKVSLNLKGRPITLHWVQSDSTWKLLSIEGLEKTEDHPVPTHSGFSVSLQAGAPSYDLGRVGWTGFSTGSLSPLAANLDLLSELEAGADQTTDGTSYSAGFGLGFRFHAVSSAFQPFVAAKAIGLVVAKPWGVEQSSEAPLSPALRVETTVGTEWLLGSSTSVATFMGYKHMLVGRNLGGTLIAGLSFRLLAAQ